MNKKTEKNKEEKRQTNKKVLYRSLIILLFLSLTTVGIFNRHHIIRYFYTSSILKRHHKSKIKKIRANREKAKIERVVNRHNGKVFGIDISHYQYTKDFNWKQLSIKTHGVPIKFVVMRASMGSNRKDYNFNHFWDKTKKNGYIRGAYHYYRPNEDPRKQATNFLNTIRLEKGDLLPILDIEELPRRKSHKWLVKNIKIFLYLVEKKYGVKPIIYTGERFYLDYLANEMKEYPLWVANYNNIGEPKINWHFWQFSDQGSIDGINTKVDVNVFNGNIDELKNWVIE